MIVQENISTKDFTTFGLDCTIRKFVQAENNSEIADFLKNNADSLYIIGGGSNIIFTDNFQGTILHPVEKSITPVAEDNESVTLKVSAGVEWDDLVHYSVKQKLGGLENLSLIPGNVGACPVQNIGAYGVEVKDTITEVEGFMLEGITPFKLSNAECSFGYRDSIFKRELKGKIIITHVTFRLSKNPVLKTHYGNIEDELKGQPINIEAVRNAVISIRERKLPSPKELGNCGSFFKNPTIETGLFTSLKEKYENIPSYPVSDNLVKVPAAWLIETCGFKGIRKGNVGVHKNQALVIVNYGNAKGSEVVELSNEIILKVEETFGIRLEIEVNIL